MVTRAKNLLQLPIPDQTTTGAQLSFTQQSGTECQSAGGTVACPLAHVSASPRQAVYRICTVGLRSGS